MMRAQAFPSPRALAWPAALALAVAGGWAVHAAVGDPPPGTLSFTGTLTQDGQAVTGARNMQFIFRKPGRACTTPLEAVQLAADGSFTARPDVSSCGRFFDGQPITYDVTVAGTPVATAQPLGTVPYAFYADVAVSAVESDTSNIARRTTGPRTLHVRADGDDTLCDGSGDASGIPANQPACAVATLARALEKVPHVGTDALTIRLGPGTYPAAGAPVLARVARSPRITIDGGSAATTVLTGGLDAMSATSSTATGLWVEDLADVTLANLTLRLFSGAALRAVRGGRLHVTNLVVESSGNGLDCEDATCIMSGNVTFNGLTGPAVRAEGARVTFASAGGISLVVNNAPGVLYALDGSTVSLGRGASATALAGASPAIRCTTQSTCRITGPVTVVGAPGYTGAAVSADTLAYIRLDGALAATGVAGGVEAARSSVLSVAMGAGQSLALAGVNAAQSRAIQTVDNSTVIISGPTGSVVTSGFTHTVVAQTGGVLRLSTVAIPVTAGTLVCNTGGSLAPATHALLTGAPACNMLTGCACQ